MAGSVGAVVRHFESSPRDNQLVDPEDLLPTTKQEEWVTKKTVEQTRKRQIETRVKRQLLLEDGHVVEDSGPMVTSSTTEDVETEEKEATEHRTSDDPSPDSASATLLVPSLLPASKSSVSGPSSAEDGAVVTETTERRVSSREEKLSRLETEEVRHLGDLANEDVERALKEGSDVREVIRQRQSEIASDPNSFQVAPVSRVVHQSSKHRKVTDTEDTSEVSRVKDGNIVKEITTKQEHDEYSHSSGSDDSDQEDDNEVSKEASHSYSHTKNEDFVEYLKVPKGGTLAEGVKVGEGMHYVSEDVSEERKGDWEPPPWLVQSRVKVSSGAAVGVGSDNRADVVTRRPLDLLAEEKARQSHTQKWWKSHFGLFDEERGGLRRRLQEEEAVRMGPTTSRVHVPSAGGVDSGLRSGEHVGGGVIPVRPPRHQPKVHHSSGGKSSSSSSHAQQQKSSQSSSSQMDLRSSSASPAQPAQRFYLGEDPFRGSIYGRESEYPGTQPLSRSKGSRHHHQNHSRRSASPAEGRRVQFNGSTTLGRHSKSSTKLLNDGDHSSDLRTRTVPRRVVTTSSSNSPSNGTINVSIINQVNPRRALNRSQSFSVQGSDPAASRRSPVTRYASSLRKDGEVHKSTPFLDTAAASLKSPGLIRSLSRSQRDISNGHQEVHTNWGVVNGGGDSRLTSTASSNKKSEWRLRNGLNSESSPRWGSQVKEIPVTLVTSSNSPKPAAAPVSSSNLKKSSSSNEDKRSVFLRGLRTAAPELFAQLHGSEDSSNQHQQHQHQHSTTPPPPLVRHSPSFRSSNSSGGDRFPDDFQETVRVTSTNDDPDRPSTTDTVRRYCRRTAPRETYEATETTKVTKSSFKEPDASGRGVVIEVRDWDRRY